MNDLSGLSWVASSTNSAKTAVSSSNSRQGTPLSAQSSGGGVLNSSGNGLTTKASTNTFENLLAPKSNPTSLSLQERQKQLIAERARQAAEQEKRHAQEAQFWEGLGSGRGTPVSTETQKQTTSESDDDLLAAFSASAPVDRSSHMSPPIPSLNVTSPALNQQNPIPRLESTASQVQEDDDPFGLGGLSQQSQKAVNSQQQAVLDDDFDILGDLGKPVGVSAAKQSQELQQKSKTSHSRVANTGSAEDGAVAELAEMGFSVERCREALAQTSTGIDVQAAVGVLLNQAHQQSKHKSSNHISGSREKSEVRGREPHASRPRARRSSEEAPTWTSHPNRQPRNDTKSPSGEKDVAQFASEIGTTIFKSANAFWKTGQKRIQKAVVEFHHEGDSSQPRWMREPSTHAESKTETLPSRPRKESKPAATQDVTDEAMMLDSPRSPQKRAAKPIHMQPELRVSAPPHGEQKRRSSLTNGNSAERPASGIRPSATSQPPRSSSKVLRQAVEEQSSQAYISPARRKKVALQKSAEQEASLDIFSSEPLEATLFRTTSTIPQRTSTALTQPATSIPARATVPPRSIPPASASALSASSAQRRKGTEAFKRGDYDEAQTCYTSALSQLPPTHPITIVIRCNRALTNIKIGEPKAAIEDSDAVLATIGISRGEGEEVSLGGAEGDKPMKEYFGKALMRKAEALENMEKWSEAGKVWKDAVEAGVGGAVAIQGRTRCDKASGSGSQRAASAPAKRPAPAKKAPPLVSALAEMNGNSGRESAAVTRLREANAAAAVASDEAFALTDAVDAKLTTWKGSKSDNLRALLASLDAVLWPQAGWTKVGMSDLVLPNKVKIIYMKAIGKVHPDKISQTATTEQRMISGAVFATLNEAWDKFKRDNNL